MTGHMKYAQYDKWENYANHFTETFAIEDSYIICGVGEGFRALLTLFPEMHIRFCLDAKAKEGQTAEGKHQVLPYEILEHTGREKEQKFLITPGAEYYSEIKATLTGYGIGEDRIGSFTEILFFWGWRYRQKIQAPGCNVFLLTQCNLNCKGCSQFTPYITRHRYHSAAAVKQNLDRYFAVFDYVKDLILVGGETMLYRELGEICAYIEERFADRYHTLKIFTNGLIVPDRTVLEILGRTKGVHVYISDYTCSLEKSQEGLMGALRECRVPYTLNTGFGQSSTYQWFDLGDPRLRKTTDEKQTRQKFERCSLVCQNLTDGKVCYCVPACAAAMGNITVLDDAGMWLDLEKLKQMPRTKQAETVGRFQLGFMEKGCLEFCFYCNGYGKDVNAHYIRAGEQWEEEKR